MNTCDKPFSVLIDMITLCVQLILKVENILQASNAVISYIPVSQVHSSFQHVLCFKPQLDLCCCMIALPVIVYIFHRHNSTLEHNISGKNSF